jgi:hypothetical protein
LILVLGGDALPAGAQTPSGEELQRLEATSPPASLEGVLAAVHERGARRVVALFPAAGLNLFALARALRQAGGPPLVLVGALRRDQQFWAERNGGAVVERLEAAFGDEVPVP